MTNLGQNWGDMLNSRKSRGKSFSSSTAILIYSPIPVVKNGDFFVTLDLWAIDIQAQLDAGFQIYLLCNALSTAPPNWQANRTLDTRIRVLELIDEMDLNGLLARVLPDIFQVPGNLQWGNASISRKIVRFAKSRNIPVIVGISSNRIKTAIMNVAHESALRKVMAYWKAFSLRFSLFYLTSVCDGTFVVGEGIKHLVSPLCKNLHVGIASWISQEQIGSTNSELPKPPFKIVVAARLEPMKGVHLAIEALRQLIQAGFKDATLTIIGDGGERARLQSLVSAISLDAKVDFIGTVGYPSPFLDILEKYRIVLVTNLNDEQPRIVFDALSRMVIPLCPDRVQFRSLGIPEDALYKVGDARDISTKLIHLSNPDIYNKTLALMTPIVREHTLESMHNKRKEWIISTLIGGRSPSPENDA